MFQKALNIHIYVLATAPNSQEYGISFDQYIHKYKQYTIQI